MSRNGEWPFGFDWDDFDFDGNYQDQHPDNAYLPRPQPQPDQGNPGGRGNDGHLDNWEGGYRVVDRGGNRHSYRHLPGYVRRLNLNGRPQGGLQDPDLWQFDEPPAPRGAVQRPTTPEPNAPAIPRPSRPLPRPNASGGEHSDECFTLWVLRRDTDQHKCADKELFRQPFSPEPIMMEDDSILPPQGTVVIPIRPNLQGRYNMGTSVMTLSNTLYTPMARYSELSLPVLRKQGFQLYGIRGPDRELLRRLPRVFGVGRIYALQHENLPGVELLYASCLDGDQNRLAVGEKRVNKRKWIEGVQSGVLGRAVDMDGTLGLTQASEHSRFEELVLDPDRRLVGIRRIPGDEDVTIVVH